MTSDVVGVILAGGRATRMGGVDKALLHIDGRTLLEHLLDRLRPQCGELVLNANGEPARFSGFGLPVIADSVDDFPGPLAGILAGMEWGTSRRAAWMVTVAADTPFVPRDLVSRLAEAVDGRDARIALAASRDDSRTLHVHPTIGLWSTALAADLRGSLHAGMRKVRVWAERHEVVTVEFEATPFDPFFNVNTPDDLVHAADLARRLT
ncbi:molybdenum cofactor guanylyltransferase MobA [Mesorhizobium sp. CAU 1741]|uniref:molybdenum cofactor guanylyltransferase MobA n=1 Tax=Mesorhizobium sp. CAU 1741 TaxID=3140366 RepID=UPI00325B2A1E